MPRHDYCNEEERTAQATSVITQALRAGGYEPSGMTESGNVKGGWIVTVSIDEYDYNIEVIEEGPTQL